MLVRSRQWWPLGAGLAVFAALLALVSIVAYQLTHGDPNYALDDAYIHMAIAKNLSAHGVWGVTRHEFTSSSSSPLWTVALAICYAAIGAREWVPFAANVALSLFLLVLAAAELRRHDVPLWASAIALALLGAATPLVALSFCGMEHVAHSCAALAFVAAASHAVCGEDEAPSSLRVAALAAIACALRYESAFLVGVACVLLAARGRLRAVAAVAAAGISPIAVFGLYSAAHGWPALPMSVLLKSQAIAPMSTISQRLSSLPVQWGCGTPLVALFVICSLAAVVLVRRSGPWDRAVIMSAMFVAGTALHLTLAGVGFFYRYEAYLIVLGIVTASVSLSAVIGRAALPIRAAKPLIAAAACTLALPLGIRAHAATLDTPTAVRNIHDQQIQLARFVSRFYPEGPVAVNDIGAISYFTDARIFDTYGLATLDVARAKLNRAYTPDHLRTLLERSGVGVAFVYDEWLPSGSSSSWREVSRWSIRHNLVCAYPDVSLYAVSPRATERLTASVRVFAQMSGWVPR